MGWLQMLTNPYIRSSYCRPYEAVCLLLFPALNTTDDCIGDPAVIHPFLAEIGKDKRKSSEGILDTGSAALHLAIRCASGACLCRSTKGDIDWRDSLDRGSATVSQGHFS